MLWLIGVGLSLRKRGKYTHVTAAVTRGTSPPRRPCHTRRHMDIWQAGCRRFPCNQQRREAKQQTFVRQSIIHRLPAHCNYTSVSLDSITPSRKQTWTAAVGHIPQHWSPSPALIWSHTHTHSHTHKDTLTQPRQSFYLLVTQLSFLPRSRSRETFIVRRRPIGVEAFAFRQLRAFRASLADGASLARWTERTSWVNNSAKGHGEPRPSRVSSFRSMGVRPPARRYRGWVYPPKALAQRVSLIAQTHTQKHATML